jgi:hypothetical protein
MPLLPTQLSARRSRALNGASRIPNKKASGPAFMPAFLGSHAAALPGVPVATIPPPRAATVPGIAKAPPPTPEWTPRKPDVPGYPGMRQNNAVYLKFVQYLRVNFQPGGPSDGRHIQFFGASLYRVLYRLTQLSKSLVCLGCSLCYRIVHLWHDNTPFIRFIEFGFDTLSTQFHKYGNGLAEPSKRRKERARSPRVGSQKSRSSWLGRSNPRCFGSSSLFEVGRTCHRSCETNDRLAILTFSSQKLQEVIYFRYLGRHAGAYEDFVLTRILFT